MGSDGLVHCPHWTECGGCRWQDRAYAQELLDKQANLEERLAGLLNGGRAQGPPLRATTRSASPGSAYEVRGEAGHEVREIIPSPDVWFYRNKMEFVFGGGADGAIWLGLHPRGAYGRVVNVTQCLLQSEASNRILEAMRRFAASLGGRPGGRPYARQDPTRYPGAGTPYNGKTHQGFLRHLVIREGKSSGDRLVHLITAPGEFPAEAWGEAMREADPGITGLMWSVNGKFSDTAVPDETRWTWGRAEVRETVGGVTFRISPTAFFQTNTRQAERLYEEIAEAVANGGRAQGPPLRGQDTSGITVLDVCAGTGGIGLTLAKKHPEWRVIGVEISPEAVRDANANAEENGLGNCEFIAGDAGNVLREIANGGRAVAAATPPLHENADNLVVTLDPPRGGLAKATLLSVIRLFPRTLIYVACNPAHLAADGRLLQQAGYRCESLQPVDMFPHTPHVEVVAAFAR